jgi:hypothetical protein
MKKVVIVGAGFSAPIGIPVMRGFFQKMLEMYNNPYSGLGGHEASKSPYKIEDRRLFGRVLTAWQEWKSKRGHVESDDLEAFCSDTSTCPELRQDTLYAIGRLCELCMHAEGNKGLEGLWGTFYRQFACDIGERRESIAVISFNYDLLPDQAFLQEGYLPDYRLPEGYVRHVNEDQRRGQPVLLFKPHGSLHWLVCDSPSCMTLTLKWQKEGSKDCPGNWPTGPERHEGHISESNLRFVMIPPEKEKQHDNVKAWLDPIHKAVEETLREAREIFFLGWSVPETDHDSLQLVRETLVNCQHAYVVNRVTNTDNVRDLMSRFYYISAGRFPITYYLGQTLGDVSGYSNSGWREALLKGA